MMEQTNPVPRLRGHNLRILEPCSQIRSNKKMGMTFMQTLDAANSRNLVLASSKRIGEAMEGGQGKSLEAAFSCWSGTLVAYTGSGKKLGSEILYFEDPGGKSSILFPVPPEFRNERDVIIAVNHPNFQIVPGREENRWVVEATRVGIVHNFPKYTQSSAWYRKSCCHGLPQGEVVPGLGYPGPGFVGLYRADDVSSAILSQRSGDRVPAYNRAFPSTGMVAPVVIYNEYGRFVDTHTPSLCNSQWGFNYGSLVESPIGEGMLPGGASPSVDSKAILEISGLSPKELLGLLGASAQEIAALGSQVGADMIKNLQALAQALDGTTKIR